MKTEKNRFCIKVLGLASKVDHLGDIEVIPEQDISRPRFTASPVPIATPTPATASAAASLNPSPTIMVTRELERACTHWTFPQDSATVGRTRAFNGTQTRNGLLMVA